MTRSEAMEEALELCVHKMCRHCKEVWPSLKCENGCEAMKAATAALALPRRNCDRFETLGDALAAWREVSPAESGSFDWWLFAATGKESEAKQ